MPTKFANSGLSYLRDILLNEVKIHPNKGFLACRGLKLWETYFFIICHISLVGAKCAPKFCVICVVYSTSPNRYHIIPRSLRVTPSLKTSLAICPIKKQILGKIHWNSTHWSSQRQTYGEGGRARGRMSLKLVLIEKYSTPHQARFSRAKNSMRRWRWKWTKF